MKWLNNLRNWHTVRIWGPSDIWVLFPGLIYKLSCIWASCHGTVRKGYISCLQSGYAPIIFTEIKITIFHCLFKQEWNTAVSTTYLIAPAYCLSKNIFLHQTCSCTSSVCLQHIFKVLKRSSESSKRSWFHKVCTINHYLLGAVIIKMFKLKDL